MRPTSPACPGSGMRDPGSGFRGSAYVSATPVGPTLWVGRGGIGTHAPKTSPRTRNPGTRKPGTIVFAPYDWLRAGGAHCDQQHDRDRRVESEQHGADPAFL